MLRQAAWQEEMLTRSWSNVLKLPFEARSGHPGAPKKANFVNLFPIRFVSGYDTVQRDTLRHLGVVAERGDLIKLWRDAPLSEVRYFAQDSIPQVDWHTCRSI